MGSRTVNSLAGSKLLKNALTHTPLLELIQGQLRNSLDEDRRRARRKERRERERVSEGAHTEGLVDHSRSSI